MSGQRLDVTASRLDDAGLGVGPSDALTVHVANLLPGERAEVAVDHASPHKKEVWARIVKRVGEPSPDRVPPMCPAFGRCGGCTWQHLAYPAQLEAKRARVVAAVGEELAPLVAPCVPSPRLEGYRNKGKYVAGRAHGKVILGAYAPRSHHVIDTLGCRVVAPIIDEVASWARGAAESAGLEPYDEKLRTGELRYVLVRESAGDVLVALVVVGATPRPKLEKIAAALAKHPAVRGVVAVINDRRDGSIVPVGSRQEVLLGQAKLLETFAGVQVELGAGEFLQVNRAQAEGMYARVAELAEVGPATRAVELFAGLGGIGLTLARAGAQVIAVEIDREAVAQLQRAATGAGIPLVAICADAGEIAADKLGKPDVVVVDPPRKGLSAAAIALMSELRPKRIIYVSCGPESLARDLRALAGYVPDTIEPFDLMPGTSQVETLVRLRRG